MIFPVILLIVIIVTLLIIYFIKKYQITVAEAKVKKMLEEHEEKVFIEEIKRTKNRNFLEKANGKDERV